MARILSLEAGKPVSRNRIKRIMKEEDLQSRQRRRRFSEEVYIRRREMRDNAPRDLLNRNFHSCEPMRILVEDITYLPTISGFRYLNSIVDLYNGEIVAYRISEHVNAELCIGTVDDLHDTLHQLVIARSHVGRLVNVFLLMGHDGKLALHLAAVFQQSGHGLAQHVNVERLGQISVRTHGQPASPTSLGKEFSVFVERLEKQLVMLHDIAIPAKFGGATGNFNAHHAAYPEIDWVAFANRFVNERLGLCRSQYTTQIEHYDNLAAIFDAMKRIDTILIDLSRDMWTYISMEYFKQRIKAGEVGSSAMPHKVNPIDFENAEGNFGIANALFEHLSSKLPVSRLQRDLTDSTVLRNVGVPMAHALIALQSLMKGLGKVILNPEALERDLENNWAVVAEGIQTILRREGYPKPYEALKALTRTNTHITREAITAFIETLDVSEEVKEELRALSPSTYTGVFR